MTQPNAIRTVGTPVRSVNWVHLFPTMDRDGRDCLVAVMGQQADNFTVVKIDPSSGATVQTTAQRPDSNYPTAAILSRTGVIYIGVAHSGCLFRYDPKTETLDDLGAINPPDDIFVCRIDEAPDGTLWIGCYGTAGLTSYEPGTKRFTRHGRMDEVDMYCYPLVAPDGTIACDVRVTRPHIVVFDPKTDEKRAVSPIIAKGEGGRCNLMRAQDGNLYFDCSTGVFRLNGFETVPVAALPAAESAPVLSDGSTAIFSDAASQIYRNITLTNPQGLSRELAITYEAAGSALFLIHGGPDGHVYGSSILPLHLFRCNTETQELEDLGACSTAGGEAYSMGNLDGKLYICSYPAARLSVYDPALPYHFGTEPGSNPRDIGRMDEISYRPRSMVTGPLGRVWIASVPDYGLWGGPLSWYDPASGTFGSYRDIAGEASCWVLSWLERQALLVVGTTIQGGTGTQPRASQATLFLWDYAGERKVWEGTPDRPVTAFNAFAVGADGRLFATVWGGELPPELVVFDPNTRVFVHRLTLPAGRPLDLSLQFGPDGNLYGFTNCCLYRVDPTDLTITPLVEEKDAFQTPGPIIGDSVYFSKVQTLKAVKLW